MAAPDIEMLSRGLRVNYEVQESGLILTLERRIVMFEKDKPPTTGWFLHSRLVVWWPSSVEETMRLVAHWLDFYHPELRNSLGGLANKLSQIPEAQRSATSPPQGTNLN
jgi:hypothetical protein